MSSELKVKAIIIGAGPAGLTAASELIKNQNVSVNILEKDKSIGGLSKTTEYKGCKFDIGPHHFITSSSRVHKWWQELMIGEAQKGNAFNKLNRFTRIYYNNHFFNYPLRPLNVLKGLSIFECVRSIASYIKVRFFPIKNVKTFEDWVTNKFGYRLFSIFFKTYTEKVWGILCSEISSDWASERIKGFSLSKAIFYAFFGKWFKKSAPRTLSNVFYYPEQGAGTLWNKVQDKILNSSNANIQLRQKVAHIKWDNNKILSVSTYDSLAIPSMATKLNKQSADMFFSTMPLRDLVLSLDPIAPKMVINAAQKLVYRGLITVNLIVKKKDVSPDHWLYVHEKTVKMGRVGNMNNFSVKMSDTDNHSSLSLEYFTFVDGDFWKKSDLELIELGKIELEELGLVKKKDVIDGMILKEPEAYPVYDKNYKESLEVVISYLKGFKNLYLMGRNGLHKYNNMDIAMLSAFKVTDKVLSELSFKEGNIFIPGKNNDKVLSA